MDQIYAFTGLLSIPAALATALLAAAALSGTGPRIGTPPALPAPVCPDGSAQPAAERELRSHTDGWDVTAADGCNGVSQRTVNSTAAALREAGARLDALGWSAAPGDLPVRLRSGVKVGVAPVTRSGRLVGVELDSASAAAGAARAAALRAALDHAGYLDPADRGRLVGALAILTSPATTAEALRDLDAPGVYEAWLVARTGSPDLLAAAVRGCVGCRWDNALAAELKARGHDPVRLRATFDAAVD